MLLTIRKRCVSEPAGSSSGKYFWFAFIVRTRHSAGTSRNSGSNSQASTFGRSTSAVTSSSRAGVVEHDQLGGVGGGDQLADDLGAALGEGGDDGAFVAQLAGVAAGVAQLDARPLRLEAVALGDCGRRRGRAP